MKGRTKFGSAAGNTRCIPSRLNGYNEGVMARQLDAVYEQGILRPLEPLVLEEHQRVRLTLDEKPAPLIRETGEPWNERREELHWLAKESDPYAGQWVALDGPRLVAHGEKLANVIAAAKGQGYAVRRLVGYVPAGIRVGLPIFWRG
jgi:predicted DNA-binding antitoxin AbrB/MazE fold protein